MDLANMRALGERSIAAWCPCGHHSKADVSALPKNLASGGTFLPVTPFLENSQQIKKSVFTFYRIIFSILFYIIVIFLFYKTLQFHIG